MSATFSRIVIPLIVLPTLAACGQPANFTSAPLEGYVETTAPTRTTVLHAAVPLDTALTAGDLLVPETSEPLLIRTSLSGGCVRVRRRTRCYGARATVRLQPTGLVTFARTAQGLLQLELPFQYQIDARGRKRAHGQVDSTSGELFVQLQVPVKINSQLRVAVGKPAKIDIVGTDPELFERAFRLKPKVKRHIQGWSKRLVVQLQAKLAKAPLREASQRVWDQIQSPTQFDLAKERWLIADPVAVYPGGLVTVRDRLYLRNAIVADIRVRRGEIPSQGWLDRQRMKIKTTESTERVGNTKRKSRNKRDRQKREDHNRRTSPERTATSQAAKLPARTEVAFRIGTSAAELQKRVASVFPAGTRVTSRANAVSPPITFEIHESNVFSAHRFLGIRLQTTVIAPARWAGRTGRVNLVARPEVDAKGENLTLHGVSFPVISNPNAREVDHEIRFSVAPFAKRVREIGAISFAETIGGVEQRAGKLFRGIIAEDLEFLSDLKTVGYQDITPSKTGFDVTVRLAGELMMVYRPIIRQSAIVGSGVTSTAQ